MAEIGAIILAAGGSSRFGRPKQLVQLGGCGLLERVVAAASEGGCEPIVVVSGSDATQIAETLDHKKVWVAENPRWREGIGTSIRAGVQRLVEIAPGCNATLILVCDQPFVAREIVRQLIEQWTDSGKPIVASAYSGTLGVPAVFDHSCFEELLALQNGTGAKSIILANPDRVVEFPFPEGEHDVDTTADYDALLIRPKQPSE